MTQGSALQPWRLGADLATRQLWLLLTGLACGLPGLLAIGRHAAPEANAPLALLAGAGAWAPLLLVLLATAWAWTQVFARVRGGVPDSGWALAAVLFALLLPVTTPLLGAVLALSFGLVLGSLVFGGSSRHPLNPALVAAVVLQISWPGLMQDVVPGSAAPVAGAWHAIASGVVEAPSARSLALLQPVATPGTGSALAIAVAALLLIRVGALSWRLPVGLAIGALATGWLVGSGDHPVALLDPLQHLALGPLAFAAVFLLGDPASAPLTRPARWAVGLLAGSLAVTTRLLDPAHPEGTLHAVLLAVLAGPLCDRAVVAWARWRQPGRGA